MRAVLDTNTVLSAILFPHGHLTWVREAWTAGDFLPLCSEETSRELIRVLACPKFRLSEEEIEILLACYLPHTEVIRVPARRAKSLPRCRDRHDEMFLALAWYGKADVLVSGDRALLELAEKAPFPIESPAQFKELLR